MLLDPIPSEQECIRELVLFLLRQQHKDGDYALWSEDVNTPSVGAPIVLSIWASSNIIRSLALACDHLPSDDVSKAKESIDAAVRSLAELKQRMNSYGEQQLERDLRLMNGDPDPERVLELLDEIKRRDSTIPVLMISGHGNIDTAVAAIRKGAADFIEKPFEADRLLHLVSRATETERLRRENQVLRARFGQDDELTGASAAINGVRATIKKVAGTGSRVLISGPAGVGKEVAARMLHSWSGRADAPFIIVAAARMDPDRVEEELFGVEDPSGLVRPGFLEQAHGGTLYLDEIADMPLTTQGKILRVLTDQSFTRVGGQRQVKVDVRVISSTARNLATEIEERRFREDLFYRLNVVPLGIPPLSERRDDIPPLVEHYLARFAADRRVPPPDMASDAMAALQANEWPGNVRQLRNVIERTMILAPGDRIRHTDFGDGSVTAVTLTLMGAIIFFFASSLCSSAYA